MDLLFLKLQQFFRERSLECYLVGGSLRDLLLNQRPQDIDLAIRGDPEQAARALAQELKGLFIPLNLEKGVKRVILPKKPYGRFTIDIAPLHGNDILDDLRQRDCTINAMALSLEEAAHLAAPSTQQEPHLPTALIDPFNGWRDLHTRTLRIVQEGVFQKDPRRLLRAIRLSASHQLSIEPSTVKILRRDAPLLIQTAPERMRDELLHMLAWPHVIAAIRDLDEYQLFPSIFPTLDIPGNPVPASNGSETGNRSWPTLTCMTKLLSASQGETTLLVATEQQILAPLLQMSHRPVFKKRWKKSPGGACARSPLLLLAALLTDLLQEGKPASQWSAEQLRTITADLKRLTLGRQSTAFIIFLLQESLSPWQVEPRPSAKSGALWVTARHYFERFGERGIDLAIFRLARQIAALQKSVPDDTWQAYTQTLVQVIEGYYQERHILVPPTLLDGETLITRFGLTKGPLIGAILSKVRNAQLEGIIRTRAEAIQFVAEQVTTSGNGNGPLSEPAIPQHMRLLQKQPGE